jgi:putative N-acetylmannosamine-6-phosphate epimerase
MTQPAAIVAPWRNLPALHAALEGRLVVSCQPVDQGPLDDDEIVARLALAALAGGAAGLRIEGAARVARVRARTSAPLIAIVKRDLPGWPVRITPLLEDVQALLAAGADVIAIDATCRPRPCALAELLAAVHAGGALAMADASCLEDGLAARDLGFDIVGSTLSGYTGGPVPDAPDLALVAQLAAAGCRVMAEGRLHTPALARAAREAGAWAVTVGSAITRTELLSGWFAQALAGPDAGP